MRKLHPKTDILKKMTNDKGKQLNVLMLDGLSSILEIDDKSKEEESEIKFNRNLLRKVDELELSVRSANCLRNDNIVYIGDLVQKSENDMLRTPNFGRKSLNEIREVLMQMGLNLGMDISDWPPENIEELSKNLDDNL